MIDRWEKRTDPRPGQEVLYWHILLGDHPAARSIAAVGQERLAGFSGLHFTPLDWLHITTLVLGPAERFTSGDVKQMIRVASEQLRNSAPTTFQLSRVLYHPEAIAIKVSPAGALYEIAAALRIATQAVTGGSEVSSSANWNPHMTIAYSISIQPAKPIIDALGSELPRCDVEVNRINIVAQEGPERSWQWRSKGEISLTQGPTKL